MRLHRFHVSQPLGEEVVINEVSLLHQWTKVFRYTTGDLIILFNGDGTDYTYTLQTLQKNSATLTFVKTSPAYIPQQKVTLYLSLIKKDNFELVAQKATELGVTSIVPILSSRSEKKNLSFERLHKILIESSEQCGRGDIPFLYPIETLQEALSAQRAEQNVVLAMDGIPFKEAIQAGKMTGSIALFIGPEGGWSPEDILIMKEAGLHQYSLGNTVLRAETAAIAAISLLIL